MVVVLFPSLSVVFIMATFVAPIFVLMLALQTRESSLARFGQILLFTTTTLLNIWLKQLVKIESYWEAIIRSRLEKLIGKGKCDEFDSASRLSAKAAFGYPMEREGKVVENADFLTDEEKEDILADNVFRFVGRNREDYL